MRKIIIIMLLILLLMIIIYCKARQIKFPLSDVICAVREGICG